MEVYANRVRNVALVLPDYISEDSLLQQMRGGLPGDLMKKSLKSLLVRGSYDDVFTILQQIRSINPKRSVPKREVQCNDNIGELQREELLQELADGLRRRLNCRSEVGGTEWTSFSQGTGTPDSPTRPAPDMPPAGLTCWKMRYKCGKHGPVAKLGNVGCQWPDNDMGKNRTSNAWERVWPPRGR